MDEELLFTARQLQSCDGESGPMYIAFDGVIYDVGGCPRWRSGLHEQQHFPGLDLSGEMVGAPHGPEVLQRPCLRRVGRLLAE